MTTLALANLAERMPTIFDEYYKPWNEWFDNSLPSRLLNVPPVNITEEKDEFQVALAAPGLKKDDFKIDVEGNMITISSEKEEKKEEKEKNYTRQEYSYSSFQRCFTIPEEVNQEKIAASYVDGVLKLVLPKKEEAKKMVISKNIAVK